jgi:hypothetical protein
MANREYTESIVKCECGRIHDCDRCPYVSRSLFFHQIPSFSGATNSLEKYNCKDCDFESDLVIILNQHIREHHRKRIAEPKNDVEVKSYICRECSFETYSALVWIKHLDTLCIKTKEDFETVMFGNDAKLHLSREDVQRFRCDKCNYKTNREYNFKRHIITRHKSDEEEIQSGSGLRCDKCDFTAKHRYKMKHHKLMKHTSDEEALWLQCEQCSYKTKLKYSLRSHMNLHKSDEETKWFDCFNCEYRTRRKGNLRRHMLLKHTLSEFVQWFACDKCHYQCKTKDDLHKHVKLHDSDVKTEDDIKRLKCGFTVKHRYKMKHHKHAPDEEVLWLRCEQCSYKTKLKDSLKRHVIALHKSDEEAKWFYCYNCEYRTLRKENLRRHMLLKHTSSEALQWFGCDKCYFQTKTKYYLYRHTQLRHPETSHAAQAHHLGSRAMVHL